MSFRAKVANLIVVARQQPGNVVLGIVGLFFLNVLLFIFLVNKFWNAGILLLIVFLTHFVWPIALIIFGILRLRRGESTDETEIKHRREVTLRYFAIANLGLLVILIIVWRYQVFQGYVLYTSIDLVIPILILSGLFVTITWFWIKYSDNKLSKYINKAPRHYLFSIITFVIALICKNSNANQK